MQNHDTTAPRSRDQLDKIDAIDMHTRKARGLVALLSTYFEGGSVSVLHDHTILAVLEDLDDHIKEIGPITMDLEVHS